jgi:PAS domain-containing protein
MHPYLLIPLTTLVCACIVGSASMARDLDFRPNRIAGAVMACAGAWALLEILYSIQTDAQAALVLMRALGFVYLPLAPLVIEMLVRLGLLDEARWARARGPLWTAVACLAIAHLLSPWFIAGAEPAPSGWRYRFGPAFWPGLVLTVGGCAVAATRMIHARPTRDPTAADLGTLGRVIYVPIVVACATDVAMPALGIAGPRLGAASIVFVAGIAWLGLFSVGSPDPASGTLARRFLDRIPDGVAVLRSDGTLRSANEGLRRILGRPVDGLIGRPVADWLETDEALAGRRLREMHVQTPGGPVPVAAWGSEIHDRQGNPIGRVLVLRDQRAVMELRRRLVSSGQMSALGALAAGIAHEVNNPIAWVLSNLNQLRRDCEDFEKAPPDHPLAALADAGPAIDACAGSLGRMVDFVAEVRSFAYAGGGRPLLCQVNELVEGALRLAAPRLRDSRSASFHRGELPEVRCAPQELKHALLGVLLTVDQEAEAGEIAVRTSATDTAVRIDVETAAPIETRALLDGTGLLLAPGPGARSSALLIPSHIVRQQGGRLLAGTLPGGGTRLRIALPLPSVGGDPAEPVDADPAEDTTAPGWATA